MANNLQIPQKKSACPQSLSMAARTICSFTSFRRWRNGEQVLSVLARQSTRRFNEEELDHQPRSLQLFGPLFYCNRVNQSHKGSLWTGF